MLEHFQQAFADLIASPELVIRVRDNPEIIRANYEVSDVEFHRLISIVNHPGMECNCMLYRANRLVPIAMNLPKLCQALGDDLNSLLSDYWSEFKRTDVHFLLESDRFLQFVFDKLERGSRVRERVGDVLEQEAAALRARIANSYSTENVKERQPTEDHEERRNFGTDKSPLRRGKFT
ncbi:MAG TPA: hypothetical protein VFZ23_00415 [Pyrinomonadaceae bacterium]